MPCSYQSWSNFFVNTSQVLLQPFVLISCNEEDSGQPYYTYRSWKASELRPNSRDDLNKLWYVLLKEKNMLMTRHQMLHTQNLRFPNPECIPKVRKSMCRIKDVIMERVIEEADPGGLLRWKG